MAIQGNFKNSDYTLEEYIHLCTELLGLDLKLIYMKTMKLFAT